MIKKTGCEKVNFKKTKHEQTVFGKTNNDKTMFEKIHLEKARLLKAMLEKSPFGKATHVKAMFDRAQFEKTTVVKATFEKTLLGKTTHAKTLFEKTPFNKITVVKAAFEETLLGETAHAKTLFENAQFDKTQLEKDMVEKLSPKQRGSDQLCSENFSSKNFSSKNFCLEKFDLEKLSFEEFCRRFHTEEACIEILFKNKWPNGYCCPRCSHTRASEIRSRRLPLYECLDCHYQVSLIKDTVMEGSRTSLIKWFQTIYLLACPHMVINAVKLAAAISVTYKTAWLILHKLRFVIVQANANRLLEGIVRVNAAVYGRPHNPTIHRHKQEHPLLVGASLNPQGELTHIKIKQILPEHLSPNGILRCSTDHFVKHNVSSTMVSDISIETRRYHLRGYQPLVLCCKRASNWMKEVYHGIGPKHLQTYLDEFCFHLNHSLQYESAVDQLFQLAASTMTITYATLTRNNRIVLKQTLNLSAA